MINAKIKPYSFIGVNPTNIHLSKSNVNHLQYKIIKKYHRILKFYTIKNITPNARNGIVINIGSDGKSLIFQIVYIKYFLFGSVIIS